VVDCAGLENRRAARLRGFESHPLRWTGNVLVVNKLQDFSELECVTVTAIFLRLLLSTGGT
jgi:hypothetical protein